MRKTKKINNKKTNWKIKRGRAAIWLLAGFFVLCGGCARKADVQLAGMSAETMYEAEGADAVPDDAAKAAFLPEWTENIECACNERGE